jgi:hypothetical protein
VSRRKYSESRDNGGAAVWWGRKGRNARVLSSDASCVLPHADHAVVSEEKVRSYLLDEAHPNSGGKGAFFRGLGFDQRDWRCLQAELLRIALCGHALQGKPSPFGRKYEIPAMIRGPQGRQARINTIWIIHFGEAIPRFVTAYSSP